MAFGDLNTEQGIKALNAALETKSYLEGHQLSFADVVVYENIKKAPAASFPHALRWYNHIGAQTLATVKALPGARKELSAYGAGAAAKKPEAKKAEPKKEEPKEDEDDIDLFGSDEEDDEENERIKAQRVAEYNAKKAAKGPKPAAKSMIILDVKPWDDETDMEALKAGVLAIQMDGLVWGTSKFVAVGYGIKKLQITCVVEDEKVSVDDLQEQITSLEDYVQSVDIAAFNKL
ncbi:elongation factor 1-beta-like protein [Gorgonomyces haynaldii]|nr:elongation factor 1-beta-like protein [Gorgonomyces haynaldii]